jgi:hypothetical protein
MFCLFLSGRLTANWVESVLPSISNSVTFYIVYLISTYLRYWHTISKVQNVDIECQWSKDPCLYVILSISPRASDVGPESRDPRPCPGRAESESSEPSSWCQWLDDHHAMMTRMAWWPVPRPAGAAVRAWLGLGVVLRLGLRLGGGFGVTVRSQDSDHAAVTRMPPPAPRAHRAAALALPGCIWKPQKV